MASDRSTDGKNEKPSAGRQQDSGEQAGMQAIEDMVPERVEHFAMTMGTVWREARVSCPHNDVLRAFYEKGLNAEQQDYVQFHVMDAACPYCQATLEELGQRQESAAAAPLDDLKERLLSSTMNVLREKRARESK